MTREEIVSLLAGRELDVLIAKKVMGMQWDGKTLNGITLAAGDPWPIPPYSTDIAAAWKLVEKLKAEACEPVILLGEIQDGVRVELEPDIVVEAETLPLAICRAALLAALDSPAASG